MSSERQVAVATSRNFKVVSQIVCVTAIDFESKSFVGFTEIALLPLVPQLRSVRLNCSSQCRIHRVTVQETIDAAFLRDDPVINNLQKVVGKADDTSPADLSSILSSAAAKVDAERGGGELMVKFPSEIYSTVDEQRLIRVGIDYVVERPSVGVNFVCSNQDSTRSLRERSAHVYTTKTGDYQARTWFPCVDAPGELCPWKLEITCDTSMTAVCSGELVEVVYTTDLRRKTFYYVLPTPTPACQIGFAVGPFELYIHPEMNELSNFCPAQLLPLLTYSCRTLHKTFEFYEELLSSRYPYGSYKQVFVDDAPEELMCFASFSILSVKLLHHQKIIDQPPITRWTMAAGVIKQFFGRFITWASWKDVWVVEGMASYVGALYIQRFFGHNEYMHHVYTQMRHVTEFESKYGPITLRPDEKKCPENARFDVRCPLTCGILYSQALAKKAYLAFRMLEKKLGKELLFQVLNKLLSVASHAAQQRYQPAMWMNMLVSTESFVKCVSNVTGQDLQSFLDQWVISGGHAEFVVNFQFNRKRNVIELDIKQDLSTLGSLKYVGPIVVTVQELDGSFTHTLQIDDAVSRHDIQCHSKARRQRKRKIPLWTGEEVDMDLNALDPDSPLLWLRFDPEMMTISRVQLQQPDYQWQYQLKHERDVLAQLVALETLPRFPTAQTRTALVDVIESDQCFYRVRCAACFVLAEVANKLASAWTGPPAMLPTFRKIFGSKSCPQIPRLNNFSNFQQYFLMKAIVQATATLRGPNGLCPAEIHQFLFDLIKYSNNSQNKYNDDHYRACVLEALGKTVEPSSPSLSVNVGNYGPRNFTLSANILRKIAAELTLALNLERLKPSYNKVVAVASLKSLLPLFRCAFLNADPSLYFEFLTEGHYSELRLTAVDCLLEYVKIEKDWRTLSRLLSLLQIDREIQDTESLSVRWRLVKSMAEKPMMTNEIRNGHPLNVREVYEQLFAVLTVGELMYDWRLETTLFDVMAVMFGESQPTFNPESSIENGDGTGAGLMDVMPAFVQRFPSTSGGSLGRFGLPMDVTGDDDQMLWQAGGVDDDIFMP